MADTNLHNCPKCGSSVAELHGVDSGMKLILKQNGVADNLPAKVCSNCYNMLTSSVSQGVKLRLEQQAREKNKQMLWKSRVNLVKHARQMMVQKAYSEAAISYEKYIKVLEISYDLKPGQLTPSVFGATSKSKELTIIATTYWDLLRIYDTNPQYRDRMALAARKLAEFIPFSPIFPDVAKKAQAFVGSAKNPDLVKEFLRLSKAGASRCFIATAAFSYPEHSYVRELRTFRDQCLRRYALGRLFILFYYQNSRTVARWLNRHPKFKPLFKIVLYSLRPLILLLARAQKMQRI